MVELQELRIGEERLDFGAVFTKLFTNFDFFGLGHIFRRTFNAISSDRRCEKS